jgi:hypothetical protein
MLEDSFAGCIQRTLAILAISTLTHSPHGPGLRVCAQAGITVTVARCTVACPHPACVLVLYQGSHPTALLPRTSTLTCPGVNLTTTIPTSSRLAFASTELFVVTASSSAGGAACTTKNGTHIMDLLCRLAGGRAQGVCCRLSRPYLDLISVITGCGR